ncbi:MAG: hypothetical protein NTX01_03625 [Candidatus Omnitrophica bacterium]|nr:hypothetical protein [Candidatus Omnitrophota bacterium]
MIEGLCKTHRRAFLVIACVLITGCAATSKRPWMEDGKRIGTIYKNKAVYGLEYHYLNTAGQLQRIEKRDQKDILLPGASVIKFMYDAGGGLIEELNYDASGNPTACEQGYVIKKYSYSYSQGDTRGRVVTQAFLDKERNPVCTTNGYAFVRLAYDGSTEKIKEVFLEDERNQPAAGLWDEVSGVAHVKFTILEGIGDVRCGVYYGPSGAVIMRKRLEGICSYYTRQTTVTYYY